MANQKDFLLPDLGEGLTEGEIVSWLVAVGDTVEVDQPVAEIETAKAVVEVPSPFAGTVTTLHAEAGDEVLVGKPLVTIDLEGGSVEAAQEEAAPAEGASKPAGTVGGSSKDAEVADMVPQPTEEAGDGASGNVLVGYGTDGAAKARRRGGTAPRTGPNAAAGPATGAPPASPARTGRPLAKPPVRKLAKDLGVDLTSVSGSGPEGTVTRDDVEGATSTSGAGLAEGDGHPTAPGQPRVATAGSASRAADGETERIALRGMRKTIALKMTISRREIPEATTWVDCDATGLWQLRHELNAAQTDVKVSPLAIIMRACVAGLRKFPDLNARLDTETNEIVLQHFVNLGFAAQTDAGLMVPVIQAAHGLSTLEIAAELNRLAAAARDRTVKPEELAGGTFTLSNYGSFGVDGGSAVINHPEAAILGVGQIADRPWVVNGELAVRKVLQLSIAFDHRICDGGEAAGFLRFVADCIETPSLLLGSL